MIKKTEEKLRAGLYDRSGTLYGIDQEMSRLQGISEDPYTRNGVQDGTYEEHTPVVVTVLLARRQYVL